MAFHHGPKRRPWSGQRTLAASSASARHMNSGCSSAGKHRRLPENVRLFAPCLLTLTVPCVRLASMYPPFPLTVLLRISEPAQALLTVSPVLRHTAAGPIEPARKRSTMILQRDQWGRLTLCATKEKTNRLIGKTSHPKNWNPLSSLFARLSITQPGVAVGV